MKQVDLRLAGAATHADTLALTDFHDKNMYQKHKYRKTHVPPIWSWHYGVHFNVSLNHSLSFSIKPFAQPPYPNLSGPIPQSIPSKYQVKWKSVTFFFKETKLVNDIEMAHCHCFINICECAHPGYEPLAPPPPPSATAVPVWQDRTIASSKLRMLEYSAFMEVQRDPDTVSWSLKWGFQYTTTKLMSNI